MAMTRPRWDSQCVAGGLNAYPSAVWVMFCRCMRLGCRVGVDDGVLSLLLCLCWALHAQQHQIMHALTCSLECMAQQL
jgi:hypothetical protein